MKTNLMEKIIAVILVMVLTMANFVFLATESYAAFEELESQGIISNHKNVEYDGYFKTENTKKHYTQGAIGDIITLYLYIGVKNNGYLKDGKIKIEDPNFTIADTATDLEIIKSVDSNSNEISLNQIDNGKEIELQLPIIFQKQDKMDLSYFGKSVNTKMTGIYIDENGKENKIEKQVQVRVDWMADTKAFVSQEIQNYLDVQIEGQNKLFMQTSVKTGIEENKLPQEKTTLTIQAPEINGIKPETVKVFGINGEGNYQYNQETGEITIEKENAVQDNKVDWTSSAQEYKISYLYSELARSEKAQITLKAQSKIKAYSKVEEMTQVEEKTVEVLQNQGSIVTGTLNTNSELNKGYLYANSGYETNFETRWEAEIGYAHLVDKLVLEGKVDQYIKENGDKLQANTYLKSTQISKSSFDKILGENGRIEIYDQNGHKIAELNNSSKANEQGNLEIGYNQGEVTAVRIETTAPITEGRIEVIHQKAVSGTTNASFNDVKTLKQIESAVNIIGQKANQETSRQESKQSITLKETQTQAEVSISNTNLSTVVKNENVEIRGILRTDSNDKDLYQNPTLSFELPKEVEEVTIKSIDLLFSEELKIKNYQVTTNANRNKVIYVEIEGNQTRYTTDLSKGVDIVINTDLTLNRLAASNDTQITMKYTNQKAVTYANGQVVSAAVKIAAPTGLVTLSRVANYAAEKPEVTSLNDREQTAELAIQEGSKIASIKMTVLNNYDHNITNPKILGRVPFVGNKKTTGEDLGTNMDTELKSAIKAEGIEAAVYYSENGTATEDLNDSNNGWTKTIDDFSKVKSYLIVLDGYTMEKASALNFIYDIEIPESLNHNMSAYATYTVFYDNTQPDGQVLKQKAVAPTVGMSTGEGPVIEAEMENNIGNKAKTDQVLTYNVTVKNTGKKSSEGTKITVPIVEGSNYAEFVPGDGYEPDEYVQKPEVRSLSIDVGTVNPNETITKSFYLVPIKTGILELKATISAANLEKTMDTNLVTTQIEQAYMKVELFANSLQKTTANKEVKYLGRVHNATDAQINNVVATSKIPDELAFKEAAIVYYDGTETKEGISYDEKTKMLTVTIENIEVQGYRDIRVATTSNPLGEETEKTAKMTLQATADGISEHISNQLLTRISKIEFDIKVTTNIEEGYVKVGDSLNYAINVKNTSDTDAENTKVTFRIPNNLKYLNTKYTVMGMTYEGYIFEDGKSQIEVTIPAGQTLEMVVETTVDRLDESNPNPDIDTDVVVETPDGNKTEEDIHHKVDDEQGLDENGKYKISGVAWLDDNQDGQRNDNEKLLPGIQVTAMNAETGKVAQNANAENITATTGENGEYILKGLEQGSYIVLFDYDTNQYDLTEYQKEGVAENRNSDAIKTTVEGESPREAAVTNTITIESLSKANIDIGFVITPKFDFKLDKTVSKITVQNEKGTTTKTYDNEKLAKIDLDGKYINNTNLIVEYKITVTNEGSIDGYAKKIIDYMPKEFKFTSELNKDWYTSGNDGIVNSSLVNEKIAQGESKDITLVLTKKMTESGTGIINNTAEILESYNDYGVEDIDSTAGSKKDGEDDMSSADVIIGLKTGRAIAYIALTTTILIAIGAGAYFVNKKVLKM